MHSYYNVQHELPSSLYTTCKHHEPGEDIRLLLAYICDAFELEVPLTHFSSSLRCAIAVALNMGWSACEVVLELTELLLETKFPVEGAYHLFQAVVRQVGRGIGSASRTITWLRQRETYISPRRTCVQVVK